MKNFLTVPAALKRRQRIGVRVVMASLLGGIVISTLVSALFIYLAYQESIQLARQRFAQIETGYLPSLAGNLWEVNKAGVDALLDGMASLPDVGRIELIDEMQHSSVRNADAGEPFDFREFPLRHEMEGAGYDVGRLRVDLNDRRIMAQLQSRAIEIGAMIYIALLVNSVAGLVLLQWMIMRHVVSIARFATTVDVANMATSLSLQRKSGRTRFDELDQVVDAFNAMQYRLREELGRRTAVEQDLRQHRENLESLVTERTLAYNASAAQLAIAADVAELGVWSMDIHTGRLSWNQRMFDIYAIPAPLRDNAITVQSWIQRVHPDDAERTLSALKHAIDTRNLYVDQFRIINDAGACRHIRARAQVIGGADNSPGTVIGINYDITEQIEIQNRLTQAKEDAEAGARVKAEFLAAMSHEIRTPMNGVLGMLNLLQRTDLDLEQRRRLQIARSSADHLLTVINDILDFSKIDAGKFDIDAVDFDLVEQIADSVQSLSLRAQEKGLELIVDVSAIAVAWVKGDGDRLRQILVNLIGNAIKFTESGEVVVRCRQRVEGDDVHLSVSITDTGIGIAEEKIASLFVAFTQVDTSMTRRFGGTGLGLVISKKLCELMGGDIAVASVPGRGSCFTFDIRLAAARSMPEPRQQQDLRGVDILIVDDNGSSRDLLAQQLVSRGATVTLATGAQDALQICERRSRNGAARVFDIGIIDMDMPEMSGVELGKRLLDDSRWSHMKMILLTGMVPHDDVLHAASLGFKALLPKPVMPRELGSCIDLVLSSNDAHSTHFSTTSLAHDIDSHRADAMHWPDATRVLLVEDNAVNRDVASMMLTDFGLTADVATTGREAINKMRLATATPYTLVLMDCQMPEMDGFAASRAIRNAEAGAIHRDVPIIALTANAMAGDRERCLQAGMNDYLAKPLDDRVLFDKLQQWLSRAGAAVEQAAFAVPSTPIEAPRAASASTAVTIASTWDEVAALSNLKGRKDRLHVLVDMFLRGLPSQLAAIEQSCAAQDFEAIAQQAHMLKGSVGQLRAPQVLALATALEEAARHRRPDGCLLTLTELAAACASLVQVLEVYSRNKTA